MQKKRNIEKIAFKVVQMKSLEMHTTDQKLIVDIFMIEDLQNIFMEHDLYLSLPAYIRSAQSLTIFKSSLKTYLFSLAFNSLSLWYESVGCTVFYVFVCSALWSAVLAVFKCAI